MLGAIRPSQRGSHQAARPNSESAAGTSSKRTTNASTSTPTASAKAIGLVSELPVTTPPPKTPTMISAAATTTLAPFAKPPTTASRSPAP
jgi:hypothetical protein